MVERYYNNLEKAMEGITRVNALGVAGLNSNQEKKVSGFGGRMVSWECQPGFKVECHLKVRWKMQEESF